LKCCGHPLNPPPKADIDVIPSRFFAVSDLNWRPGLSLLRYKSSLRDFSGVRQFL
jgi:hypothetical protein